MNAQRTIDALRDVQKRKGTVYIKNKSPDGNGFKLVPGRVVEVLRGAVRIQREGVAQPTVVRFADVEFGEPEAPRVGERGPTLPPPAPVGERKWPAAPVTPLEPEAKVLSLARPSTVESPVDAWLALGRELTNEITNELLNLDAQRDLLLDERAAIDREIDQLAERKTVLTANLAKLSGGK